MTQAAKEARATPAPPPWRANLGLFLATAGSVFVTGVIASSTESSPPKADDGFFASLLHAFHAITTRSLINGGAFAGTLLTILVAHELGHYIAARIHKVDASLPFFIPMPILSPFGTMGAIIRMRGVIPTRRALLDIGASGPLAGLLFAIPLYCWGVSHSHPIAVGPEHLEELGESVLIRVLDHFFAPALPDDGSLTLVYSPVAFGAWGGFFVTMINLLPASQLDGGHVAYALFGPRQDRIATIVHRAMFAFFWVIVVGHVGRDLASGRPLSSATFARHIGNALFWLVWFQAIAALGTMATRARPSEDDKDEPKGLLTVRTRIIATVGLVTLSSLAHDHSSWVLVGGFLAGLALLLAMEVKGGAFSGERLLDHPPTAPEPLDPLRKGIAIVTLVLFALLFMPEPFSL